MIIISSFGGFRDCAKGLTGRVVQLFDGEGEAAVGALDAEEDHGDVLRGAAGGSSCSWRGAVVCVALVQRELVVLPTGELLSLQNPAVKHLQEEKYIYTKYISFSFHLITTYESCILLF